MIFLNSCYVLGLQTFGTLLHLELNLRALIQGTVSRCLDSRKVDKYVIARGALDKTIALRGVEPFHDTFFSHLHFS